MAFPVLGTFIDNLEPSVIQLDALRQRDQLQIMRDALLKQLFRQGVVTGDGDERVADQLAQIAQILGRQAGNEPTIYDNGSSSSSASGYANGLTQKVERALTQVLGRAPGRGYDGFVNALNGAFPTDAYGKVMMTPARSVVSLTGTGNYSNVGNGFYSPASLGNYQAGGSGYAPATGNGYYSAGGNGYSPAGGGSYYSGGGSSYYSGGGNGYVNTIGIGQLSVEQANLYRQASIIAEDMLRVLESLQPFDPVADIDAVEALRGLIRSQITTLVDEFGRIDEPRRERVDAYLDTLLTADFLRGSIVDLGVQARLASTTSIVVFPVTVFDETQVAGFELLKNYADTLRTIFGQFITANNTSITGQYSERLTRAYILLPVLSDSNTSFMAAMDSIGFTASERRSDAALFSILGRSRSGDRRPPNETRFRLPFQGEVTDFRVLLPDITVNDFNEWVERFATLEAPSILSTSGQFGLDFVTDQADTLFWVIGAVLDAVRGTENTLLIDKVLSFERVQQTLSELLFQLDTLADLGEETTVPSSNNILPISSAIVRR